MNRDPSERLIAFLRNFFLIGFVLRAILCLFLFSQAESMLGFLFLQHAGVVFLMLLAIHFGHPNLSILLMGAELAVLSIRLVWLFGTAPLFHIYAMTLVPVVLLFEHLDKRTRSVMMIMPIACTMILALVPLHPEPVFLLNVRLRDFWSFINLCVFTSVCMGIILYHIKELRVQRERAEGLARQRTQLISDLSHELKTPLATILARTQTTLSRPREPSDYEQALRVCERNAQNLRDLSLRMMEYMQAEQNHYDPEFREINLPDFLSTLVQELAPLTKDSGFRIRIETPDSYPVQTDPFLLTLVIRNILVNALQHARGGDHISIQVETEPRFRLTLSDNGPGIPENKLSDIFNPFTRGDTARSGEKGSVGLGLSIARESAQSIGMELRAYNLEAGGACFELSG